MSRFEEEYLREARDKEIQRHIDGYYDIKTDITQKRMWYRETFDHVADDVTVSKAWEKHHGK